ncbi:interferon alpha-inducible IFI6/IFI27 family protein [Paenibacillus sp. EC2-1]|uniref:interferon alpha-inducible IFI6/IFI27 family protein n=1 Tax=Paenibacillus sp. EC2-1 TaxID=3388665 RepID=UPI003BEEC11F
MNLLQTFTLNEEGYTLIQKLVLFRIEEDLSYEHHTLRLIEEKQQSIAQKSGFIHSLNKAHKDHAASKVMERIRKKEEWKAYWEAKYLLVLPENLRNTPIDRLISQCNETSDGRVQLFLIMQEVIHTPIYCDMEPFSNALEETYFEAHIDKISLMCGFGPWGKKIYKNTEKFFKDIKDEGGKLPKWGITGLVGIGSVATVLALPVIAPAVGGILGLSGAAATSARLAMLGGGSIAAGGLGIMGGMTVLVGGSSVLGTVAGGAVGKMLSQIPQEAVALSIVKNINLIHYLKSDDNRDQAGTMDTLIQAQNMFLEFKQQTEREMVTHGIYNNKKDMMQMSHILNRAFRQLIT